MPIYYAFDERATQQGTRGAKCLDGFAATADDDAMRQAAAEIEVDFVLFRSCTKGLKWIGERRREGAKA